MSDYEARLSKNLTQLVGIDTSLTYARSVLLDDDDTANAAFVEACDNIDRLVAYAASLQGMIWAMVDNDEAADILQLVIDAGEKIVRSDIVNATEGLETP